MVGSYFGKFAAPLFMMCACVPRPSNEADVSVGRAMDSSRTPEGPRDDQQTDMMSLQGDDARVPDGRVMDDISNHPPERPETGDGRPGDVQDTGIDVGSPPPSRDVSPADEWPFGQGNADTDPLADAQHDLLIGRGQTVVIPAGRTYDFRNITVLSTGVLELSADEGSWTVLGVSGTLLVDGEIRGRSGEYAGGQQVTGRAPAADGTDIGEALAWFVGQAPGGEGQGAAGQFAGNGGGAESGVRNACDGTCNGTGGGAGSNADENGGGNGGASPAGGQGGTGSRRYGAPGGAGANGGGGGGGHRGRHGQLVYLKVDGEIAGNGVINLRGGDGTPGGTSAGGDCGNCINCNQKPGYAGGGGAGGSGGVLIARGVPVPRSIRIDVSGGSGGPAVAQVCGASGGAAGANGLEGCYAAPGCE